MHGLNSLTGLLLFRNTQPEETEGPMKHLSDNDIISVLVEYKACRSPREITAIRSLLAIATAHQTPWSGKRPRTKCQKCGRDIAMCRDGSPWGHSCP